MINKIYFYGLCLSLTAISGCNTAPKIHRNNLPSQIDIVALDLANMHWKLRIKHRHQDTKKGNQLACQMTFNNHQLSFLPQPLPDLNANAVETITIQKINADPSGFLNKNQPLIEYQLSCHLSSENFNTETINKNSVLYQVPGQQGLYR